MEKSSKKIRESGLELLKIICIVLIILHHYSVHGGYKYTVDTLNKKIIFIQILSLYGKVACSIFALSTGYFMIKSKASLKENIKKALMINIEMFFYSAIILGIFYYKKIGKIDKITIKQSLISLIWGNWYIVAYTMLLLLIPYLNKMIKTLSKSQHRGLIILMLIIWCVIPTITDFKWKFSDIDFFIVMYVIGGYIRLYEVDKMKYANKWNLIIVISSALLLVLSVFYFDNKGIKLHDNNIIKNATKMKNINSIYSVILAISSFLLFKRFTFKSKIINRISQSTLGIYLIHDNDLVRPYLWKNLWANTTYCSKRFLVLIQHITIKTLAVFLICLVIDQIRLLTIDKVFRKIVDKYYDKLYSKITNLKIFKRNKNQILRLEAHKEPKIERISA